MTFRTTFRDTRNSRQIALINLPCPKNARRIFAIVSTTSIPTSASIIMEASVDPQPPGSRLDADHPENGDLIPRRNTPAREGADQPHMGRRLRREGPRPGSPAPARGIHEGGQDARRVPVLPHAAARLGQVWRDTVAVK